MTTLPPEDNSAQGAAQPEQPAQPVPPQQPTPPQQPAAPQYEAPPAAGYQQPQYAQQPAPVAANPVSNLQLNYWLSVFFTWLPALIFWLIEKDKGDQRATKLHVDNFNFSLLRTIAYLAIIVIGWIPYIGWIIAILLWLAQIVLFVFHIIAATKVKTSYETDGKDPFIFNIPMVK